MSSTYLAGSTNFWPLVLIIFLRYFLLASIAYLIYYVIKRKAWQFKRIQKKFPQRKDYIREFLFSIGTTFVFAIIGYLIFATPFVKYTRIYWNFNEYSFAYFLFSIVLMIVVHDTYFYWTHRWMHHPKIFKYFHKVHHLSTNPSPWAAMAFHPLEAFLEGAVILVIAVTIPFHPIAIGLFLLIMMIYNVYGHLGYEIYPKGFSKTAIGKWINTSVNHNMHHQFFNGNYGLYFLFWDRLMGTLQHDDDEKADHVKNIQSPLTEIVKS